MVSRIPFIAIALAASAAPLSATDFRRADSNSDSVVSLADAHYVLTYLFRGGAAPECLSSADSNDTGNLEIADGLWILNYLFRNGPPPEAPSPETGPDPTPDTLDCASYGSSSPLIDPAAMLTVLDATAPGGADGKVTIRIAVSSSASIAGYSGSILLDGPIGTVTRAPTDLSGTLDGGFATADLTALEETVLRFAFLSTFAKSQFIPAGSDVAVLEIEGCLEEGTVAGEFPLVLDAGELVDTASGRSIFPALESGVLTVVAAVSAGAGCSTLPVDEASCAPPPPAPSPLPQVDAMFRLDGSSGFLGGEVVVPFKIRATEVTQAYSFSVDFDEEVLEMTAVEEVFQVSPRPVGFKSYFTNNESNNPGSGGVDEGFAVGAAVFNLPGRCGNLPANQDNEVLRFHFDVRPDAPLGMTEVAFLNGGRGTGQPVTNVITALYSAFSPETEDTFVLVNARVNVLPDLTAFVRGDSNGDQKVDISDAANTLGFLFLGDTGVACFDAADANDDGAIDIADAVTTLNHLFEGGKDLPPPYPAVGEDPTPDTLGCLTRQ